MNVEEVLARTEITGFELESDVATLKSIIKNAYEKSPTLKGMVDDFLLNPNLNIRISYKEGVAQGAVVGDQGTGRIEIDLKYDIGTTYIGTNGNIFESTPEHVFLHELTHALTGKDDNYQKDYYLKGDNVEYVNKIYSELEMAQQASYIGWDDTGKILKKDLKFTNGKNIDTALFFDEIPWSGLTGKINVLGIGKNADSKISLGDGDDFLAGMGGNDILKGGAGTDTAVYFGNPSDYDVKRVADGRWTVAHVRGEKTDGTDSLENIEKIQFNGGTTYSLTNKGLSFQTDFAFVIDTTGSMGSSIDKLKGQAASIIGKLFEDGKTDARVGVVSFRDELNGEPTTIVQKFTDQVSFADRQTAVVAQINGLKTDGGGDLPETSYSGLLAALDGRMGEWRPGAGTMRIALFTDAAAKDVNLKDQVTKLAANIGVTISSSSRVSGANGAVDKFEFIYDKDSIRLEDFKIPVISGPDASIISDSLKSNIEIYTIFTGGSDVDTSGLSDIANATGGNYSTAASDDALITTLLEIIDLPPDTPLITLFETHPNIAQGLSSAYEVLLAGIPNEAGFSFLINSAVSTNFGAGAGVTFNQENIFINLVNNLVQGNADAKARFDAIATGTTLEEKVTSIYNAVIPASKQSAEGLAFILRPEGLQFYQDVAAERGVAGTDGAAIVSLASLLKLVVTENFGVGNAVNDLINAVAAGSAALPATGSTLTALEVADGAAFDGDDAVAMVRIAAPPETTDVYLSSSEVADLAHASTASIVGIAYGHDGGWVG